jgi:altronate hydrolase
LNIPEALATSLGAADFDTGPIIDGEVTIEQMGEAILDRVIEVASGKVRTKAEILGQNDFIPWKRGVSL